MKDPSKKDVIGQNAKLSYYDSIELNLLYKCYGKKDFSRDHFGKCDDISKPESCAAGKWAGLCGKESMKMCAKTCGRC